MDIKTLFNILEIAIYIVLGWFVLYWQTNAELKEKAAKLIDEAENAYHDTVKSGGMKHEYVIEKLFNIVPIYLRPIITKEMIGAIVDNTFISIESYASQQLNKIVDKTLDDKRG